MDLGLPVLARDVPGNAAIVEHMVTGLLYSSPQVRFTNVWIITQFNFNTVKSYHSVFVWYLFSIERK